MLRNMFKKTYIKIDEKFKPSTPDKGEPSIPEGLWRKCNKCSQPIYVEDVKNNFYVCPKCGGYFRVPAYRRLELLLDEGTFIEWNKEVSFTNPLDFPGYERKIQAAREKTQLNEAVVTGEGTIEGIPVVIGVCDARFIMSSMGYVVGEKITQAIEEATKRKRAIILYACSGGARMQEGLVSLMQMAKTAAALKRHHETGQLFISVLTDPTTGGVTASFAMLGDIILAEPKALIGFAGPRVIKQTIGQKLPEGFQRSEFLLEHGFVDCIVERKDQKVVLARLLRMHNYLPPVTDMTGQEGEPAGTAGGEQTPPPDALEESEGKDTGVIRDAWESVLLSRKAGRPVATDYIKALFDDFTELHGDRLFGDDKAIVGGIAFFHNMPVTVIGQQKGKNTKENVLHNFGMPSPEGYRKALRLMKEAEAFGRPIICFVDTPGAFCGIEAEERGEGEAIAKNLFEMSALRVPVLSIVIGEGGSGGALAMAVADEVWMMENAVYSILSPEGFASILYKDSKKAPEASRVMKMTARELRKLGLIDRIIPEEEAASMDNIEKLAHLIENAMEKFFHKYLPLTGEELAVHRYQRFRRM